MKRTRRYTSDRSDIVHAQLILFFGAPLFFAHAHITVQAVKIVFYVVDAALILQALVQKTRRLEQSRLSKAQFVRNRKKEDLRSKILFARAAAVAQQYVPPDSGSCQLIPTHRSKNFPPMLHRVSMIQRYQSHLPDESSPIKY